MLDPNLFYLDWVGEKTEPKPCQLNPERINLDLTKHDQSLPNPGTFNILKHKQK